MSETMFFLRNFCLISSEPQDLMSNFSTWISMNNSYSWLTAQEISRSSHSSSKKLLTVKAQGNNRNRTIYSEENDKWLHAPSFFAMRRLKERRTKEKSIDLMVVMEQKKSYKNGDENDNHYERCTRFSRLLLRALNIMRPLFSCFIFFF